MSVDTEPTLTITTETTDVGSLEEGDLLHVGFPLPHYQVVDHDSRGHMLSPNRRSAVMLIDSEGVEKRFLLSPNRKVSRVTNPEVPVGPWFSDWTGTDISEDLSSWQREDALWHRALGPPARLIAQVWRAILDLQCRAYTLKLRAGFWGFFVVILFAAVGLMTRTAPEMSVAAGIVGAFIVERCWEHWRARTRRKLAKGVAMRVRYKASGSERMRYGTLQLRLRTALIVDGRPGQVWRSTEMCLLKRNRALATCAFANDIRGDLRYTNSAVAELIRRRLDNGSDLTICAPSPKYDPAKGGPLDIEIAPSERKVNLSFADRQTDNRFSIQLKLHQARVLADVLEVMDEGRRS